MEVVEKVLPFSSERYYLNQFGEILNKDKQKLEVKIINGEKQVELEWINGKRNYNLGAIVAIVKFEIKLPEKYWERVEAIYEDNNPLNTYPENITYRFRDGPIETEEYPGYFYIPYFTQYAISREGELINLRRNVRMKWGIKKPVVGKNIKGGYRFCGGLRDDGHAIVISRHRAICHVFKPKQYGMMKHIVNHIDGVPGNDFPENLEWVTYSQNNKHAYDNGLFPNKTVAVLVKELNTGKINHFKTLVACAKHYGKSESSIKMRCTKQAHQRRIDGLAFKLDDGSEWPILEKRYTTHVHRAIACRNIFTGKLFVFNCSVEAEEITGVKSGKILNDVLKGIIIPACGYNFQEHTCNNIWPNYSARDLLFYQAQIEKSGHFGSAIIEFDEFGKETNFYPTVKQACDKLKMHCLKLTRACVSGRAIKGKTFSYYKPNPSV